MTRTSNLKINVIREVTGCDKEDAENILQYMEDHSGTDLGKMKLSVFVQHAIRAHLLIKIRNSVN